MFIVRARAFLISFCEGCHHHRLAQRFFESKTKLSDSTTPVADDQTSNTVSVEDVLMPDIYGENDDDTQPLLNVLDPSSTDTNDLTGFDPYDTAVLQKK